MCMLCRTREFHVGEVYELYNIHKYEYIHAVEIRAHAVKYIHVPCILCRGSLNSSHMIKFF